MPVPLLVAFAVMVLIAVGAWLLDVHRRRVRQRRREFIRAYRFPPGIFTKLREKHPHLDDVGVQTVARSLRGFFLIFLRSDFAHLGMPSRVTDDLWHEFILDTRAYADFCERAFGRFFHHIPAADAGASDWEDQALRRTWRIACLREGADPRKPAITPLLFSVDRRLAIPGALAITMQCSARGDNRCGARCGGGGSCGGGCGGGCGGA